MTIPSVSFKLGVSCSRLLMTESYIYNYCHGCVSSLFHSSSRYFVFYVFCSILFKSSIFGGCCNLQTSIPGNVFVCCWNLISAAKFKIVPLTVIISNKYTCTSFLGKAVFGHLWTNIPLVSVLLQLASFSNCENHKFWLNMIIDSNQFAVWISIYYVLLGRRRCICKRKCICKYTFSTFTRCIRWNPDDIYS